MSQWRKGGGREAAYGVRTSLSLSVIWPTICRAEQLPRHPGSWWGSEVLVTTLVCEVRGLFRGCCHSLTWQRRGEGGAADCYCEPSLGQLLLLLPGNICTTQPATLASVGGKFVADRSNDLYHKRNNPVYIWYRGLVCGGLQRLTK